MSSVTEFFYMGGYAFYVWTSYGLALLVLVWVFFMPLRARKQIFRELRMKYRQQERQQQERKASDSIQAE